MFDYTAIIVAIITSISTIAGIYLKEWLFPKRREQKLTIEKSNCYIELDKICASIRDTIHANAVYIAYFHNGGHFINGAEMDKYTVVGEDYDCCVVSYKKSFKDVLVNNFPYLFHKPVNCTFQFLDGVLVSMLYRIHNTVFNVIL